MADANNPAGTGTTDTSEAEASDRLAGIFGDPETDTDDDAGDNEAVETESDAEDGEGDEPNPDETEDEDETEDQEDGSDGKTADESSDRGRFVADNAKVKLDDGRVITIGELRKSPFLQADYTRKSQRNAEEYKALTADRQAYSQKSQQLEQVLALNWQWLEATRPQEPEVDYRDDPLAYGEYQQRMGQWDKARSFLQSQIEQYQVAVSQQQKAEAEKRIKAEREVLNERIPAFRNEQTFEAFMAEAKKLAPTWGIDPDDLKDVYDHRYFLVLKDAIELRRLKARSPEVRKDLKAKPLLKGQKRSLPKQEQARTSRTRIERLHKTGSDADAAAALDAVLRRMSG